MKTTTLPNAETQAPIQQLKLGVDWHAEHFRVTRMCDGQSPQPAQRFTPANFLPFVQKQLTLAEQVFVVYEAGPGGFHLHRQLTALGVTAFVVHPQKLDPQHKGVVTDKTDARELTLNLDRYLRGNLRAMSVVRVPTPAEEQRRALSRQREQLRRERQRLAAQGRSLCLTQGIRLRGEWWQAPLTLPDWLEQRLAVWRQLIQAVEARLEALTQQVEALAPKARPKGLGPLTLGLLIAELCDWSRFKNRKQIGSYTGLCGGVSSSGPSHCDLSIFHIGDVRTGISISSQNPRINKKVKIAAKKSAILSTREPRLNASTQTATHKKISTPPKIHTDGLIGSIIQVPTPDSMKRIGSIAKNAIPPTSGIRSAAQPLTVGK